MHQFDKYATFKLSIFNNRFLRDSQKVDINIRVGVHSGGLFAGVLGATKLQYDIWGGHLSLLIQIIYMH